MIKSFLKSNYKYTFVVILSALVGGACIAYGNYVLTPATNALKNADTRQFIILILVMLLLSALGRIIQYGALYIFTKQEQGYFHILRKRIVSNYYEDKTVQKLSNMQNRLTNDLRIIDDQALTPLYNILICLIDLIFSAYVVLTFNFWLLCLILVLAVIMLYLPRILVSRLEKATNDVSSSFDHYIDTIEKWLSGLAVLQRYRSKSKLLSVLSGSSSRLENATNNRVKKYAELESLSHFAMLYLKELLFL